jgi:type IV secretory pathway TraG/TraD family ATPase VirD4
MRDVMVRRTRGRTRFKAALAGTALGAVGLLMRRAPEGSFSGLYWPWLVAIGVAIVVLALVAAIRERVLLRTGIVGAAVLVLGIWFGSSQVPEATPGKVNWGYAVVAGSLAVALTAFRYWQKRGGSAALVNRWSRRGRRNEGVASAWAIWRTSSATAARKRAAVLRPSLREMPRWRRGNVSLREFATPIARVGFQRIWSPVEDVTLRIGGPRSGKTGELACRIADAPGAVIATSTRTDLIDLTKDVRSQRGPLYVFNPSGLAGLESTITFDPLAGCADPTTATARASDLLAGVSAPGRDGGDREYWTSQARRVLAALLHAAALGEREMRDVLAWVADPDEAAGDVTRLLRRSPEPAYVEDAAQFLTTNDRTRSSICATIMPALGWLTDSTAAAAATGDGFEVEKLLAERGTVYMLGAEEAQVAPLVTALTGHIARKARRLAALQPGGRLDPPLTLALDEAALICPIPLDNWTADMGGRNVTIHIAAQSRAQLRQRWGDTGAAAIMNNAAALMIFGGTRDPEDLNAYSTLTGERDEKVETFDALGESTTHTTRRVPVLSPGQIAQLPFGHVVIIRRGMAPAVGKVQMAWNRRDTKAAKRHARWAQRWERFDEARERAYARFVDVLAAADAKLSPKLDRLTDRTDNTEVATDFAGESGEDAWGRSR